MFKRTIAAVLSGFICASAITSGAPPRDHSDRRLKRAISTSVQLRIRR